MDRAYVDRRFEEIVDFAGVAKFIDTPVKRYSSGMYLRLAFAVAAHLEPDVLIVDEVLAVGDAQFQKKCLGKMSSVSKEGRTVLFVSHNLTAVRTLCTRAILLRQGRLIADESANDAVSKYVAEVNQNQLEREYDDVARAPQNTSATIRRVALRNERSAESDEIDTSTPLAVEIDYETKSDDAVVGFTLLVHDAENNAVFISISNRETQYYGRPMAKGAYRTTCHIPPNLLNAGWFTIGLNMFGSNFSDNRFTHEILRFEVQDSQEIRGDYFGPYWGAVRPALEWSTEPRFAEALRAV
jgi:lipopolysaccharide transport system ATP-binding protein